MPALVAGIHVFFVHPIKAVMAETSPWDKPGHDGGQSQGLEGWYHVLNTTKKTDLGLA